MDSKCVYIFTFQPSVREISKNNGIILIFHLGPIKRNLKYFPGNIQDPIKKICLESAFHKL